MGDRSTPETGGAELRMGDDASLDGRDRRDGRVARFRRMHNAANGGQREGCVELVGLDVRSAAHVFGLPACVV